MLSNNDVSPNNGPIKIFGGSGDMVDFGDNGAYPLYDQAGVRYTDNGSVIGSSRTNWVKNGSQTVDGVTFDVYEYHNSSSSGGAIDTINHILVQQGIVIQ